jgi:hypothetical protein
MKCGRNVLARLMNGQKYCITLSSIVDPVRKRVAIGFAVCDEDDKWDGELGERIARGRAASAMYDQKCSFFKRPDVLVDFAMCGLDIRGIKKLPKSIYFEAGHECPKAIEVFMSKNKNRKFFRPLDLLEAPK